jgi:DNA replication ATP-dependent helicase Dna2
MNVSFTRARSKLIIIGSRKTLQQSQVLAEFFNLMSSRGWILRLPRNAEKLHDCLISENKSSPCGKRSALDLGEATPRKKERKENSGCMRPLKRMKGDVNLESGILRSRPILKDLMNACVG